jgi:phosphoribosyl 1,2-cyclic phosphodiesterase
MSLNITSLNSGSNGNCYYIGNDHEAVLVDAGISCKETEIRMKRLGLDMEKLKAIFVSHEHNDHIKGLMVLSKKYQLPVYITEATHKHAKIRLEKHLIKRFRENEPVLIGELSVTPFQKFHDAEDPYSFLVSSQTVNVGIFTDLGVVCEKLIQHFQQCHAAFLEANYDEEMLQNGSYPFYLKKRITDGKGHLSNTQALDLFKVHRPSFMSHLILSHLSNNNNKPEIVNNLFIEHANGTEIVIASRHEETPLFKIVNTTSVLPKSKEKKKSGKQQLSLFE